MKLTYQTGIAALIQLAVMTFLNVINGIYSSVEQCSKAGSDCLGNIITSMLYFMVITVWFALLWIVAAGAQERRSRKLALALIAGEFMVLAVSLFNAQHYNNLLGLTTSLVDATLALWVGILAFRLFISGGARVTTAGRGRRRRLSKD